MKKCVATFLQYLAGDIFKLLPMKEEELQGATSTLNEYLDAQIINVRGALKTFPELGEQKKYIYIINNLEYLRNNEIEFAKWRKTVLNSTRYAKDLSVSLGGQIEDGELE